MTETTKPCLYVMVGVPGSGKSTWAQSQDWVNSCAYISTDMYVEAYAHSVGRTYTDVFEEFMPKAVELMAKDVVKAREQCKDIIWDQTSTTVKSRARKFAMLPDYRAIAVVFKTPSQDELNRRLKSRVNKVVPAHVIEQMISEWEEPSLEEGFDEIWHT
jgi:predicted kinase